MIRLFVPCKLAAGTTVELAPSQAHYLTGVMRARTGDQIALFNGADGEWIGRIAWLGKGAVRLEAETRFRPQAAGPDLDLVIALVKRPRLETIVEKAAELGVRRIRPVVTSRTISDRTNPARLAAIATEAAEQTGRLDTPEVRAPQPLDDVLRDWPTERRLMFCDEAGEALPALAALEGQAASPWAILIGPEGGFSEDERSAIRALPAAVAVSLGPRILRADTAAIAALTLWQSTVGDWRGA